MDALVQGFWPWMTEHWFLGFWLMLFILAIVITVVLGLNAAMQGFLKIFHRKPPPNIVINLQDHNGQPRQVTASSEDATRVVQDALRELRDTATKAAEERRAREARPSRYERILGDEGDELEE